MTFLELREATLQLPVRDRWRLLWEIVRSLVDFWGVHKHETEQVNINRGAIGLDNGVDLECYRGVLNLTQDPLDYQKEVRSEWD
jgi:hypothetical protein